LEQVFRKHLRDLEGDAGAKIVLRIPSRVTVSRKTFRLRPEEVKSAVIRELQVSCADCEFQIANLVVPLVMTDIPHGATWSVRMRPEMPKGSFSLPLEVINPDGGRRTYWISGLLTISKKVPVASRSLAIGEHLRAEDYSLQTKDVTFATDVSPSENEIKTSTVSRSISAGQVIWRSFLRREQLVKMGDAVRVVAGADDWQVSIEGIAQGGGYAGDSVKVKIPRTQKMITGQLTDAGTVEVRQ
jgi:flagella basal body P-ring formation protein FlgA